MNDSYLQAAFKAALPEHETPMTTWVSLYVNVPYYGGPEEGGWWGEDCRLVATKGYQFKDEAEKAKGFIQVLAEKWSVDAKKSFNERCRAECDWLEARGLDDDFLPEVDGELHYWVTVEDTRGEHEHTGSRHYE